MGFNKRNLPDLEELKIIHKKFETDEDFIKHIIGKADVILGPPESHRYIETVLDVIKELKCGTRNK